MKTLYLKTTMKLLRLLTALIFFMLALSYNARSQTPYASPNPVCYGQPINLFCGSLFGCGATNATYRWVNLSGSYEYVAVGDAYVDPVINQGENGYAQDRFYLSIQYVPPPGGFSGSSVQVNFLPQLFVNATHTNNLCFGESNGTINITASGGRTPYRYLWSNGSTLRNQTGLTAGTYTVTVTDNVNCFVVSAGNEFIITEPPAIALSATPGPVTCNGTPTGSIDLSVSGGTPDFTYVWSNGALTQDIGGLTAGTYAVTVTDANLCKQTGSYEVTQPGPITVDGTPTGALCNGGNGSIDITVTGGEGDLAYSWSNGATTQNLSGVPAGTYTVTVYDANECFETGSWEVTQPSLIEIEGTVQDVSCNATLTGEIDITATGGTGAYTYLWSTGAVSEDLTDLAAGTYYVTVKDANLCEQTASFVVTEPDAFDVTEEIVHLNCNNVWTGAIYLNVDGGTPDYSFEWSNGELTEDITGLSADIYTVTITDANQCVFTQSYLVTEPLTLSWNGVVTPVSCNGGSDGSVDGTTYGGTPPYAYYWAHGATDEDLTGLTAGDYFITVTDANSCIAFTSRNVPEPTDLVIVSANVTPVSCNDGNDGAIDISVDGGTPYDPYGTPYYTYLWSNGETSQDLGGLTAGFYSVVVTDANNCTETGSWEVTEPAVIVITGTATAVLCNGGSTGSINITVNGGTPDYSYVWSNMEVTEDITGLAKGFYTVTVTDANNCTQTASFEVTEPSALSLAGIPTQLLCNGASTGSIDITVTGGTPGYTYSWNNGANIEDIGGLTAGTYVVTVTDANDCTITGSWEITAPPALSLDGTPLPALCFEGSSGSIDITVSGGTMDYSYLWSNGESSEDIGGLTAGWYSVIVTDANDCTITGSWEVTQPTDILIEGTVQDVFCFGSPTGSVDITVSGGTGGYTYLWSNGTTTEDLTAIPGGTYIVTVKDANQCEQTASFVVTTPDPITVIDEVISLSCNNVWNGAINLTVSGGTPDYSFEWSNGEITEDISGLSADTYTVTITDANSCVFTQSYLVTEPLTLTWNGVVTPVSCYGGNDGSVDGTTYGGTPPYTYYWAHGATDEDLTGLTAGDYFITVTDAHSCIAFTSRNVPEPTDLVIVSANVTPVSCNDGNDGAIDISVDGGTPFDPYGTPYYTYLWSNGETSEDLSGLTAGFYSVVVTDANNCTETGSWEVTEPSVIVITGTSTPVLCNGGSTGSIDITVSGGTPDYSYVWSNMEVTEDITGLAQGFYTVTVTDANNCTQTAIFEVTEPSALTVTGTPTHLLCNGARTGSIDITVTGGTPGYTYSWNNGANIEDIGGLTAGTYVVTVTDANDCTVTGSWEITAPSALTLDGTPSPVLCFEGSSGSIDITVSGGTMDYNYLWSNGESSEDIGGLTAGWYSVIVTDANDCSITGSWEVTQPTAIVIEGTASGVACYGDPTGSVEITVSGGTAGYTYLWSNNATSEDLTGVPAGTYTVVVTDANQCEQTASFVVTTPDPITVIDEVIGLSCNNVWNGSINLTVSGGTPDYGFEWSNGEITEDISGLSADTYTVTITDANSCVFTQSYLVTEPLTLTWNGVVTPVSCYGGNDGSVDGTTYGGTPPYTYYWAHGATDEDLTGLTAGDYFITVTDAHSCIAFTSRNVPEPTDLVIVDANITNVACNNGNGGAIDISVDGGTPFDPFGTPYYTYLWSNGETSEDLSGLTAGFYSVIVTDANNCTETGSWEVTEPSALSLDGTTTAVLCNNGNNGSIDITVSGGTLEYGYSWSNGETSEDISGLTAGVYAVTVTDANDCVITGSWEITQPGALILVGEPTPVACNGGNTGAVNITVTGGTPGYTYAWNNGANIEDIGGLTAGTYVVTVTDANNCTITGSWEVTEPPALSLSGTPSPVLCNGGNTGSIDIDVQGGTLDYTYLWSNNYTTDDIGGLTAGWYTVTVTDANDCTITGDWEVTEPDALTILSTVTPIYCNGTGQGAITISVIGGTPDYTYVWSNSSTLNSPYNCCLFAGCYTVTVTDDNGCEATASWCITEPDALTIDGGLTHVNCNGQATGAIDITVSGGTPEYWGYEWSNGDLTEDIFGLTAGIYTVTVHDGGGCTATASWEITQSPALTLDGTPTPVSCNGGNDGSIDITVGGGTADYFYYWSNGFTSEDIDGLTAGVYTVVVSDAYQCIITGSWEVTEPPALSVEATITDATCYEGSTGEIDLTVTGGTPLYGYEWSNGATTEDLTGIPGGWYYVTVTDANDCEAIRSYFVDQPDPWSVEISGPTPVCCNSDEDFTYYANVDGYLGFIPGTEIPCTLEDLEFEWSVVGGFITGGWNTDHITVHWLCCEQGTISVTVTKCDGCEQSDVYEVIVTPAPAPEVTGPASVLSNTDEVYCALPAIPGHLYTWTVIGGSYTSLPGSNCITVHWGPYPVCGCGQVIVCETDPITGCTACDTLYITILPNPNGIDISGTVSYKNVAPIPQIPLNGVTVNLRDAATNVIVATTVTGPNMNPPYTGDPGYYAFTDVPDGSYKLQSSFNGTWGGNNATDALLVQQQAAVEFNVPTGTGWILNGLYHTVGDVNASNFVTALDALYIKLRVVGSINSYPAGDWKFEEPMFTTTGTPIVVNYAGLCVGDVNGSYIPTSLKEVSFLSVVENETQTVPVGETFAYQIRSNMVAQLGAMTLFMGYDKDRFEVLDVTTSSNDEMKYVIEDGNVAIAWADTKPLAVKANDQLLTLTVKAKAPIAEATQIFNVKTGSEFASPTASRYDNFDLKMSKVITAGGSKEFSVYNYPNPFADNTKIVYSLPESCKVTLVITDMFGKTVRTLVDDTQNAGTYTIPVNAVNLNLTAGVYLYRIEAVGAMDNYVKVNKMIFAK